MANGPMTSTQVPLAGPPQPSAAAKDPPMDYQTLLRLCLHQQAELDNLREAGEARGLPKERRPEANLAEAGDTRAARDEDDSSPTSPVPPVTKSSETAKPSEVEKPAERHG